MPEHCSCQALRLPKCYTLHLMITDVGFVMTHRLTVELSEQEMGKVQAVARSRKVDPTHLTVGQLVEALTITPDPSGLQGLEIHARTTGLMAAIKATTDATVGLVVGKRPSLSQGVVRRALPRVHKLSMSRRLKAKQELSDRDVERVAQKVLDQAVIISTLASAAVITDKVEEVLSTEDVRAKRLAAAMSVNGMWKDKEDKPQDGLAYQREVRAEWR